MTLSNSTAAWRAADAAHHLHPFTNTRELNARGPRVIVSAKGVHLTDSEGNRILDGMAGLWCASVGFGRDEIADAVAAQLKELTFYNTFFNTTHPPMVELSRALAEVTPPQFNRFFFTGSGSESNDTILKLVTYYWELMEQPERRIFVSRRGGYHGSTVATAALGGFGGMHKMHGVPVGNIFHAPAPSWWDQGGDLSPEAFGLKIAHDTLSLIDGIGANRVAAFIGEPIMGAGGVIIPPSTYWPALSGGLKERGVLLISDEVICGFGRTGQWFGCETMGTEPDLMTMAKGLTAGYVPMGAVAVSDRVANVLLEKGGEFAHGYTYSGHPAACAAALATLNIMHREKLVERVRDDIGPYLQTKWATLADHPLVGQAVMTGMIGAMQLTADKSSRQGFGDKAGVGMICREHSFNNGLIMRAVGERMVIAPPLVLTHAEAEEIMDKVHRTLDMTLGSLKANGLVA
jgi:putrescine aminotransferase